MPFNEENIPYIRTDESNMEKTMVGKVNNYWIDKNKLYMSYHVNTKYKFVDITDDIPIIKYLISELEKKCQKK